MTDYRCSLESIMLTNIRKKKDMQRKQYYILIEQSNGYNSRSVYKSPTKLAKRLAIKSYSEQFP